MDPTLVVLAAGMGSRYGGLKQLDPIGPGGETLLDYAVFDAVRAGFGRVVFVIRRDFETVFRERIGGRYAQRVRVDYAYQSLADLPVGFAPPAGRVKPWGTGHAVWCARDQVRENFAVINADDFYGADSFRQLAAFLKEEAAREVGDRDELVAGEAGTALADTEPGECARRGTESASYLPDPSSRGFRAAAAGAGAESRRKTAPAAEQRNAGGATFAMVGFRLANTLSEHGAVSRGVCVRRDDAALESITECTGILAGDVGAGRTWSGAEIVSMNCWGFTPALFSGLDAQLREFLATRGTDPAAEFYLPAAVSTMIGRGQASVRVLPTEGRWFGVTYREDQPRVVAAIAELVRRGEYPARLFA